MRHARTRYAREMQNDAVGVQRSRKVRRYINFAPVPDGAAEVRDQTNPVDTG